MKCPIQNAITKFLKEKSTAQKTALKNIQKRTIIEKLEKYSNVSYAFIILTPDDVGGNFIRYKGKLLEFSKIDFRARQNVVLEFGYFIGLLGREKVCCLYKGNIELPSDMHGICYVHFQESITEVKDTILKELNAADYKLEK